MNITLATLHEATEQEVFDQVATHLLTQNKRSYNEELATCAYRSPDGLKCAAGCLIADEEYDLRWEDATWITLSRERGVVPSTHACLIEELQRIHDNVELDEWSYHLESLAKEHELEYNQEQK